MNQTVLIADRDGELCELLAMYLGDNGFEAETASSGLDCLEKLRQSMPDVLVLDLELDWGGSDGILAWLKDECASECPSVVLTATAGYPIDARTTLEPPVVDYLSKPFTLNALLEIVLGAAAFEVKT